MWHRLGEGWWCHITVRPPRYLTLEKEAQDPDEKTPEKERSQDDERD